MSAWLWIRSRLHGLLPGHSVFDVYEYGLAGKFVQTLCNKCDARSINGIWDGNFKVRQK